MSVIKVKRHKDNYVIMDTRPLRDERLSWKARGLLVYLVSRPENWTISAAHLASISSADGPRAIRSGLKELQACGYARLDTGGATGGRHWVVYETPELCAEDQGGESSLTDVAETATSLDTDVAVTRTSLNANIALGPTTKDHSKVRIEGSKQVSNMCTSATNEELALSLDQPKASSKLFQKPTREAAVAHGQKIGLPESECDKFLDYYEANGWKVGRNPMKVWTAAMQNWLRNWKERYGANGHANGNGYARRGPQPMEAGQRVENIQVRRL